MVIILQNNGKQKKFDIDCTVDELCTKVDEMLPRIETQLNTSVDFILNQETNEATFLCDGVSPMLFEFIAQICQTELKKIQKQ